MRAAGEGPAAIAKALGCSRMSIWRVIGDGAPEKPENERTPVASVEAATSRPKVVRVQARLGPAQSR
jgi:hypothetical protein